MSHCIVWIFMLRNLQIIHNFAHKQRRENENDMRKIMCTYIRRNAENCIYFVQEIAKRSRVGTVRVLSRWLLSDKTFLGTLQRCIFSLIFEVKAMFNVFGDKILLTLITHKSHGHKIVVFWIIKQILEACFAGVR